MKAYQVVPGIIVFPTLVGVFPVGCVVKLQICSLPHARGGVSQSGQAESRRRESSPRSWGCFRSPAPTSRTNKVFPTLVGVFPSSKSRTRPPGGLPHARGGVSFSLICAKAVKPSSPRSWGCFTRRSCEDGSEFVFPTLVGVFPPLSVCGRKITRLPHARGGVSSREARESPVLQFSPRSWGCFRAV